MDKIFYNAKNFNGDLSKRDFSNVTSMNGMFYNAENFNGDLSKWSIFNVRMMSGMFYDAQEFNVNLSSWNINFSTNYMLEGAINYKFNKPSSLLHTKYLL